jgi:hypothetical protein
MEALTLAARPFAFNIDHKSLSLPSIDVFIYQVGPASPRDTSSRKKRENQ